MIPVAKPFLQVCFAFLRFVFRSVALGATGFPKSDESTIRFVAAGTSDDSLN